MIDLKAARADPDGFRAALARKGAAEAFDRFVRHCNRYWTLAPRRYPRGVFKFRSLEEAQAARRRT